MHPNPGLHANANSIEIAAGPRGRGNSESGVLEKETGWQPWTSTPSVLYIRSRAAGFQGLEAVALGKLSISMDPSKMSDTMEDPKTEHLDRVPSQLDVIHDDVFGELTEDGPNYRNVHCIHPAAH